MNPLKSSSFIRIFRPSFSSEVCACKIQRGNNGGFCLSIEEPLYILQRKKALGLIGLLSFLFPEVQELDPASPPAFVDVDLDSNP